MNLLCALEQLGFENGVDFTLDINGELTWKSKKKQPTSKQIEKAWTAWYKKHLSQLVDQLKINYKNFVDGAAEITLRELVKRNAQQLVYQEKVNEATTFKANGYKDLEKYPYLTAEVKQTHKRAKELADEILKKRAEWVDKSSRIEALRIKTKMDIDGLETEAEMAQHLDSFKTRIKSILQP